MSSPRIFEPARDRWWTGSGGLLALYVIEAVGAVAQNIIFARMLPVQAYGLLSAVLSAGMFVFVVSDFGTGISVCRLHASPAQEARQERFRQLWTIRLLLSAAAVCLVVLITMARFPEAAGLVALVLMSELCRSVAHFIGMAARGAGNVSAVAMLTLSDRWGSLGCSAVVVLMGGGLKAIGFAYLIPRLIALALGVRWTRQARLPMRPTATTRQMFSELRAVSPIGMLLLNDKIVFYSMPLLIAMVGSAMNVAMFQASMKVALLPISICSALVGVYFPEFVKEAMAGRSPKSAVAVYSVASVLSAPVVALCLVVPNLVLRVLFGASFEPAAGCLRVMAAFIVLNVAYQISVHLLPAYGRERILGRSTSVASVACVVVVLMLVPAFGAVGGAIAVALYAVVALVPNGKALRGAWHLQPKQRNVLSSGWIASAACVGLTGALLWFPDPVLLLGLWSLISAVILLGYAYKHREMIRGLFVEVKTEQSVFEHEQEAAVRLG